MTDAINPRCKSPHSPLRPLWRLRQYQNQKDWKRRKSIGAVFSASKSASLLLRGVNNDPGTIFSVVAITRGVLVWLLLKQSRGYPISFHIIEAIYLAKHTKQKGFQRIMWLKPIKGISSRNTIWTWAGGCKNARFSDLQYSYTTFLD